MEVAEVKRNKTIIKTKRALRAIEIAKILFEDEGYHTRYLEAVEKFLKDLLKNATSKYRRGLSNTSEK